MTRVRRSALSAAAFVAVACLLALAFPVPVAAHSLGGRFESPLPLATYLLGAAIAVALSFAFVTVRGVRAPRVDRRPARAVPRPVRVLLRAIGLAAWTWVVAQTMVGGSSTAEVSSLFLWVYGWVGLAIVYIWTIQLVAVVGGHLLGAWAGHAATADAHAPEGRRAVARQVALAALMVALTTTTLWSLGQSVLTEPATADSAVRSSNSGPPRTALG
jgi:hypothetical protein